jgi:hypothetical protein
LKKQTCFARFSSSTPNKDGIFHPESIDVVVDTSALERPVYGPYFATKTPCIFTTVRFDFLIFLPSGKCCMQQELYVLLHLRLM